jgi:hypothetical protein
LPFSYPFSRGISIGTFVLANFNTEPGFVSSVTCCAKTCGCKRDTAAAAAAAEVNKKIPTARVNAVVVVEGFLMHTLQFIFMIYFMERK